MLNPSLVFGGLVLLIAGAGFCEYWVRFHAPRQAWFKPSTFLWLRRVALAAAIGSFYLLTSMAVPSLERHTGSGGALRWLASIPGAMTILSAYEWPLAIAAASIPPIRPLVEAGGDAWCEILQAPDTTP